MIPIIQSGNVTPGNLMAWVTAGVARDGGPPLGPTETVLARLLGANFNMTIDQAIPLPSSGVNRFNLTRIIVTNASLSLTTAQGGFYPQPSKGGSAIVSAAQAYSALTAATVLLNPTLTATANTTVYSAANLTSFSIYFSLSVAQGVPSTGDIYLCGIVLS